MPWSSLEAAKDAGAPTTIGGVPLTLAQVNKLAAVADAAGDADEPWAVAIAQFKESHTKSNGKWVSKKAMSDATYETEPKVLFGPGVWRAMSGAMVEKSDADCEEMAANFAELAGRGLLPQVKIGHSEKQTIARMLELSGDPTGEPALGHPAKLWWDTATRKLMGVLTALPKKLADMIKAKQYSKISLEISDDWWDGERKRKNVVTGISILGAKWPAMNDQPDDLAIATAEFGGQEVSVMTLSLADATTDDPEGGETVEKPKVDEKVEEEAAGVALLDLKGAAADEEETVEVEVVEEDVAEDKDATIAALKAQLADALKKLELAARAKSEAADKARTERVDEALDAAVKGEKMTPAQVMAERAVLMSMDHTGTVKFADADGNETEFTPLEFTIEAPRKVALCACKRTGDPPFCDGSHKQLPAEEA